MDKEEYEEMMTRILSESIPTLDNTSFRDNVSATAMQGIMLNCGRNGFDFNDKELIAKEAVGFADCLINELNKGKDNG